MIPNHVSLVTGHVDAPGKALYCCTPLAANDSRSTLLRIMDIMHLGYKDAHPAAAVIASTGTHAVKSRKKTTTATRYNWSRDTSVRQGTICKR